MGKTKAFDNIKTFDDLKKNIFSMIEKDLDINYMDRLALCDALLSLRMMNEQQQNYLLNFMHQVDIKLSFPGAAYGNIFHKLPTVLSGCIYITNFPNATEYLSIDELIVLAHFSIIEPLDFYVNAVEYLGKDLLNVITKKHFDYREQTKFLNYATSRIKAGETKEQVAEYIKKTPLDQLKTETTEYEKKLVEEAGKHI